MNTANTSPRLIEWLEDHNSTVTSRTVLLRVSVTAPPSKQDLSKHCVVVSYDDAVVVIETTKVGLRELLNMDRVIGASEPVVRKFMRN